MHCPSLPPPVVPLTQVDGKQQSSLPGLHIPNLGVHCSGKLGKKTPLQVLQFDSLSWHHGTSLQTLKNCEQQVGPLTGDSVGCFTGAGGAVGGGAIGVEIGGGATGDEGVPAGALQRLPPPLSLVQTPGLQQSESVEQDS